MFKAPAYSLWWPVRRGSARKGYLFQASGIRVGKSVISVGKNWGPEGLTDAFFYLKKSRKKTFKTVQLEQLKRIQSSQLGTGSRGDVFLVRTSEPVGNLWKNGLFWSRYSFVTHSVYRKPRDWGLTRSAYRRTTNKVYLGQIRSEEVVYSRFIKIPLG